MFTSNQRHSDDEFPKPKQNLRLNDRTNKLTMSSPIPTRSSHALVRGGGTAAVGLRTRGSQVMFFPDLVGILSCLQFVGGNHVLLNLYDTHIRTSGLRCNPGIHGGEGGHAKHSRFRHNNLLRDSMRER